MRWFCVLVVVAACGQKVPRKPWRPAPPMPVEEVAAWFMKAALAGDDSTARTLTLRFDHVAQFSNKANDPTEWETAVTDTLTQLAREGDGEEFKVKARVVDKKTLTPAVDKKVTRDVDVAIIELTVNDKPTMPMLFIRTDEGWKFSPKN
jgi:hypothetical protein